jgi:YrbI family 3-deoxy-D-manno-octulosonate 8-phosphate phosphatase
MFKWNEIDLIAYDFDGVMTNNSVIVSEEGLESVIVNRSDGLAVGIIKSRNIPQLILSKERNKIVSARASKLGISVLQGIDDKKKILLDYCSRNSLDLNKVIFVGNDLNDVPVMSVVGYPMAPQDAYPEVKKVAKFIIPAAGGTGVVRELLNFFISEEI